MPKVYKNKKKFIDPRYFMDEKTEKINENEWPDEQSQNAMMGRASSLANRGMAQAAGEPAPPWQEPESQYAAPSGDSVTDEDVIRSIYNLLKDNQSPGYRALSGRFMEMMKERGVISQESGDDISSGYKLRANRLSKI